MSRTKAAELRNLSLGELQQKQAGFENELHDLRQKRVTGQLDKPHHFKRVRRQIAQILTITKEKKKNG
jgi:large subunit ribosomal protein L29